MTVETLLDGHLVQGHVDQTAKCTEVKEAEGSWYYTLNMMLVREISPWRRIGFV